jgi:hypothetical protein
LTRDEDFSNASFPPETIKLMKIALDGAVASLPDSERASYPRNHPALCQRGGKRSISIAKNGAPGTADNAPLIGNHFSSGMPLL